MDEVNALGFNALGFKTPKELREMICKNFLLFFSLMKKIWPKLFSESLLKLHLLASFCIQVCVGFFVEDGLGSLLILCVSLCVFICTHSMQTERCKHRLFSCSQPWLQDSNMDHLIVKIFSLLLGRIHRTIPLDSWKRHQKQ